MSKIDPYKEYNTAFPYMKNWREIWKVEESVNKILGQQMRDYLRTYGMLPTQPGSE